MQVQENRVTQACEATPNSDEHSWMLAEVDFKWLMAGQGWWIDPTRFHEDPSYALGFLRWAMASQSQALRDRAASLQALIDGSAESNAVPFLH